MRGDWFSVDLKNHLNLSIAFPTRYLAMSSLFAFRLFPVVQEFGDEVLCSFAPQYPKSTPASSCNLIPLSVVFVSQSPVHW